MITKWPLRLFLLGLLISAFCSGYFSITPLQQSEQETAKNGKETVFFIRRTNESSSSSLSQKQKNIWEPANEKLKEEWLSKLRADLTETEILILLDEVDHLKEIDKRMFKYELLAELAETKPAFALEQIIKNFGFVSSVPDNIKKWLRTKPEEAIEFYERNKKTEWMHKGMMFDNIVSMIAQGFAGKDHQSSWEWMNTLSPGVWKSAIGGFIDGMIEQNPGELESYLARMDPAQWKDEIGLNQKVEKWLEKDFDSAKSWVEQLPEDERAAFLPGLYYAMCRNSEDVAKLLFTVPEQDRPALVNAIGKCLLDTEPYPIAGQWIIDEMSDERAKRSQISELIYQWGRSDTAGVRDWIADMENISLRDQAIRRYVNHFTEIDPQNNAWLVEKLSESEQRLPVLKKFVEQWSRKDPQAVRKWIGTTDITQQERNELNRLIKD